MKTILQYLLESLACSAIFAVYYQCFLRGGKFYGFNRAYLLLAPLVSLLIPLIHITYHVEVPVQTPTPTETQWTTLDLSALEGLNLSQPAAVETAPAPYDYTTLILTILYLLPLLWLLCFELKSLLIIKLAKRDAPTVQIEGIDVCTIDSEEAPFTFFNTIFWRSNIDINSDVGQRIFRHELAHVQAGHSYDKLLMQLLCMLFWMNPILRIMKRELDLIHEYSADSACVAENDTQELSALILCSLYPENYQGLMSHFFQSNIKKRIIMLSKTKKSRFSLCRKMMIVPVCMLVIYLFTVNIEAKYVPVFSDSENTEDTTAVARKQNGETIYKTTISNIVRSDTDKHSRLDTVLWASDSIVSRFSKDSVFFDITDSAITAFRDSVIRKTVSTIEIYTDALGLMSLGENYITGDSPMIIIERDSAYKGQAETIASISVLKNEAALKIYGEKGKNGVVIVKLKSADSVDNNQNKSTKKQREKAQKQYEKSQKQYEKAKKQRDEAKKQRDAVSNLSDDEIKKKNEDAFEQLAEYFEKWNGKVPQQSEKEIAEMQKQAAEMQKQWGEKPAEMQKQAEKEIAAMQKQAAEIQKQEAKETAEKQQQEIQKQMELIDKMLKGKKHTKEEKETMQNLYDFLKKMLEESKESEAARIQHLEDMKKRQEERNIAMQKRNEDMKKRQEERKIAMQKRNEDMKKRQEERKIAMQKRNEDMKKRQEEREIAMQKRNEDMKKRQEERKIAMQKRQEEIRLALQKRQEEFKNLSEEEKEQIKKQFEDAWMRLSETEREETLSMFDFYKNLHKENEGKQTEFDTNLVSLFPYFLLDFVVAPAASTVTKISRDPEKMKKEVKELDYPVILIDDKEVTKEELNSSLDKITIKSYSIMKGTNATSKYGEKAKNGVLIIETEKPK